MLRRLLVCFIGLVSVISTAFTRTQWQQYIQETKVWLTEIQFLAMVGIFCGLWASLLSEHQGLRE